MMSSVDGISRKSESVWDYPRPPRVELSPDRVIVKHRGLTLIDTTAAVRVLETSHPPTYYLPIAEFAAGTLVPVDGTTLCEFKGVAHYFDLKIGERLLSRAAWTYSAPTAGFELLRGMVAIYPGRLDHCTVAGEQVRAQAGDFYGGWINSWIIGPFKGEPGTMGW